MAKHRILFVCLGNICRSPMAEGVFRRVAEDAGKLHLFEIDSAGMGDWHKGEAPDHRAQKAALDRGVDISGQAARKVELEDFEAAELRVEDPVPGHPEGRIVCQLLHAIPSAVAGRW